MTFHLPASTLHTSPLVEHPAQRRRLILCKKAYQAIVRCVKRHAPVLLSVFCCDVSPYQHLTLHRRLDLCCSAHLLHAAFGELTGEVSASKAVVNASELTDRLMRTRIWACVNLGFTSMPGGQRSGRKSQRNARTQ